LQFSIHYVDRKQRGHLEYRFEKNCIAPPRPDWSADFGGLWSVRGNDDTSDDEQGTATISSANGSLAVAEGDAAQKTPMPDYAPQYPGSTITNAMTSGKDGASKTTVLLTTTDPVSKVGAFYTDTFSRLGLELKQNVNSAEAVMLAAEAQAKKASVIIGTEGQLTTAVVTFSHN
jgi:hypothetical protein